MRAWFERLFKGSYVPHVIEPSAGLDSMALAVIAKAFEESEKVGEKGKKEVLTVLRFHPRVAPNSSTPSTSATATATSKSA
jgi:glycyl-tRNA synthetase